MSVKSLFGHFGFYLHKYGIVGCLRVSGEKVWTRVVGQWEWLYFIDLNREFIDLNREFAAKPAGALIMRPYNARAEIEPGVLQGLAKHKSTRSLTLFLDQWFSRGGTLWVAMEHDAPVGVQWTLQGGMGGFYSVPIASDEVIVVAVEVFPEFRGRGVYPRMAESLCLQMKERAIKRIYLKVADRNRTMQRSMEKLAYRKSGKVYTRRMFGYWICVWPRLKAPVATLTAKTSAGIGKVSQLPNCV